MRPADKVEQLFHRAAVETDRASDDAVFDKVKAAYLRTRQNDSARQKPTMWRFAMRTPQRRIAVAAAVVVATAIGLFMWTGTQSDVALADVLTRIREVRACVYLITTKTTRAGAPNDTEMQSIATVSEDYGIKLVMERVSSDGVRSNPQEMYMSPQKGTVLTLLPQEKRYMLMQYDESTAARMREQSNSPSDIVEMALAQGHESLGRTMLDGVEVEAFRSTDPNFLGVAGSQPQFTIYVDVQTRLPVRMETDMQLDEETHQHTTSYDFQWDVAVDAAEFDPVIPDDYAPIAGGTIQMPTANEEKAIEGLRLFADLSGQYPRRLDLRDLLSEIGDHQNPDTPMLQQFRQESQGLSEDEMVKKILTIMMPLQALSGFHAVLMADNKDPAYYGEFVTPTDADQVLMRWKVSDNEYRVIFGSLHVETVTADVLAELEKTLPQ